MWTSTSHRDIPRRAAGGSLQASRPVVTFAPVRPGGLKPGPWGNTLITPDGTKIVTVTQPTTQRPGSVPRSRVTQFSVHTGRVEHIAGTGTLLSWDVLWTSPSGRTLVVIGSPAGQPVRSVLGILTGQRFTRLPGTATEANNVAW
jgi:hypothetical protein